MSQPHNHHYENRVEGFVDPQETQQEAEVIQMQAEELKLYGEAALYDDKLSDETIGEYVAARIQSLESKPTANDLLQTVFEASVAGAREHEKSRLSALNTLKGKAEDWVKGTLFDTDGQFAADTKELRRELFFLLDDYEASRANLARAVAETRSFGSEVQAQKEADLTLSAMLYVWREDRAK